jgi:GMP synthase-like glutamine amidotransferase
VSRRALVLDHGAYPHRGFIEQRARQRGFGLQVVDSRRGSPFPSLGELDLIIVLGSAAGAYDDSIGWVRRELELLESALAAGTPVLGICFGGQLLARAMGGSVIPGDTLEAGWRLVETADPDLVPEGPWLEVHRDEFTVPPGACEIARNQRGAQAFVAERAAGLQFHPEADPGILDFWLERGAARDAPHVDIERLRVETGERAGRARELAIRLFDRVWERIAPETPGA